MVHQEFGSCRWSVREVDENDWVLPPPGYETWPDNPYAPNEDGVLIEEHPDVVGTPTPATFTLYSINGMIFVGTALWLASDLTARHSDDTQQTIGYWLKIGIVLFSIIWTYFAFKKWKLMHNIIDTPSSRVRSVAAGPAELVGQVSQGLKAPYRWMLAVVVLGESKVLSTTDGKKKNVYAVETRTERSLVDGSLEEPMQVDVNSYSMMVQVEYS